MVVGMYDVDQIVVEETTVTGKLVVKVETETCGNGMGKYR